MPASQRIFLLRSSPHAFTGKWLPVGCWHSLPPTILDFFLPHPQSTNTTHFRVHCNPTQPTHKRPHASCTVADY